MIWCRHLVLRILDSRVTAYVVARLRALANGYWLDSFDDPSLSYLPSISSDHSPILLFHRKRFFSRNIPFKFEDMWLSHDSFPKVVEKSWATSCNGSPQYILATKKKILKCNLKVWNRDVFGQLKKNIVAAEKVVLEAQAAYNSGLNVPL